MKKANVVVENHFMLNYFELFALEQEFNIDKKKLHQNYIKLQKLLHPDKQINKTSSEKTISLEYAAQLNLGYKILNDDKLRAEYLLKLHNIIINQEENNNIIPDPIMLNEILELNEEGNIEQISLLKQDCWDNFNHHYAKGNLSMAAQAIIKLQYLNKINIK